MPCHDITDVLKLLVDHEGNVRNYALRKKTCGGEVGRKALIKRWLKGRPIDEILATPVETVIEAHPSPSDIREYLVIKHFLAVRTGIELLTGKTSGGVEDYCTVDSIEYLPEGILLIAQIRVEGLTDQIKACGSCASCSTE